MTGKLKTGRGKLVMVSDIIEQYNCRFDFYLLVKKAARFAV